MKILLKGVAASKGIVKGRIRVLLNPNEVNKFQAGEILVLPSSSPLYTVAILKASAIITDIGGILSHAAIVARELGIPCVTGAGKATEILKDNMEITVDGEEGVVYGIE
jgi:pyruvate,water dikinase